MDAPLADPFALNLRHLRAVAAVAATGSVSAAAQQVSLSQPALTQGITKLEGQFATRLFERRPKGMAATPAGRLLAARAGEAIGHLAEGLRPIRRGAAGFAQAEQLVTTTQLRALLALADAGSYVSAAQQTGLSQPALHRAVRDIERLAGAPLVERRGRGVALTDAGRRVARGLRLAVGAIAAGLADIAELAGEGTGSLAVGAMPMARARLLPEAMARLHRTDPRAAMQVVEGAHRELIDLLRDGRIDLTLGALRDPPPGPDVVQRALFTARLSVVARADHPLVRSGRHDIAALGAFPWILAGRNTPLEAQWRRLFAGAPLPQTPIECGSVMTIRGLLLAGDYLTLLSPDQVWVELELGLLGLVGPPIADSVRTIGMTTRADWRPTATQRRFVDFLEAVAAEALQENQ
jgi:DNA-binding transcriptional LysR family regulator